MLLRRVRDRIGREAAFDLEALARDTGLTTAQFVDRFRRAYGATPHDYQRSAHAVRTLTSERALETR